MYREDVELHAIENDQCDMITGADHVELMTSVEIKCDEKKFNSLTGIRTSLG